MLYLKIISWFFKLKFLAQRRCLHLATWIQMIAGVISAGFLWSNRAFRSLCFCLPGQELSPLKLSSLRSFPCWAWAGRKENRYRLWGWKSIFHSDDASVCVLQNASFSLSWPLGVAQAKWTPLLGFRNLFLARETTHSQGGLEVTMCSWVAQSQNITNSSTRIHLGLNNV